MSVIGARSTSTGGHRYRNNGQDLFQRKWHRVADAPYGDDKNRFAAAYTAQAHSITEGEIFYPAILCTCSIRDNFTMLFVR